MCPLGGLPSPLPLVQERSWPHSSSFSLPHSQLRAVVAHPMTRLHVSSTTCHSCSPTPVRPLRERAIASVSPRCNQVRSLPSRTVAPAPRLSPSLTILRE